MPHHLSSLGEKLTARSGILELMDDLGNALQAGPSVRMLGGGNPARIPAVEAEWRRRMDALLKDGDRFERMLAHYDTSQGQKAFIRALVQTLRETFGWEITERNIAITNGSQNAFFYLFALLAGRDSGGRDRQILLPLVPEYIGYADQALSPQAFLGMPPAIDYIGNHHFKYCVQLDALPQDTSLAALCLSRPTNPSGNVVTDPEIRALASFAGDQGVPLIVDSAYGAPFPNILFVETTPYWDRNVILSLSLSKLGLPGTRTGILIADEPWIEAIVSMNAVVSLANGNLGQTLVRPMLEDGTLLRMSREVIQPFDLEKSRQAQAWIQEFFPDDLPYRVHLSEGALFLWMWFPGLPIPSAELYRRLKQRDVLVISGHYFFYGLPEPDAHSRECIRITYSQSDEMVREGLRIIAEEVMRAFGG